jgi:mono/diheme cytochrome c family protein
MQLFLESLILFTLLILLSSCSMGEEMRRIEAAKQASQLQQASTSTNLTGEQLFVRSCNTCHPGGKEGMGPRLDRLDEHFPTDSALAAFIRKGKGIMPPQPKDNINDDELNNLIGFVRNLSADLKDASSPGKVPGK